MAWITFDAIKILSLDGLSSLVEPDPAAPLALLAGEHLAVGAGLAVSRNGRFVLGQEEAVLITADDGRVNLVEKSILCLTKPKP